MLSTAEVTRKVLIRGLLLPLVFGLGLVIHKSAAFSLLGPHADWMKRELGYYWDGGGPMDLNEEYRWNVPVLTYGFDRTFLDHFGSNGVAAVEAAFDILRALPPADALDVRAYPLYSQRMNYAAHGLHDLKSNVLLLLLRQMGLEAPSSNLYAWRKWDDMFWTFYQEIWWPPEAIPTYILERNYDPETLLPTRWVNGNWYTAYILAVDCDGVWHRFWQFSLIDPDGYYDTAAADFLSQPGLLLTGLTRDDVGGLRYLLSTNNVNLEALVPGVRGIGPDEQRYVDVALRPGVGKISFLRVEYDSVTGRLLRPFTNQYTDICFDGGLTKTQQVERVVTQPDFLFSAGDCAKDERWWFMTRATDTARWWNSSAASGQDGLGPGVIRPPVRLTFDVNIRWASFDGTTNAIIAYPPGDPPGGPLSVRLNFAPVYCGIEKPLFSSHLLQLPVPLGSVGSLETSTNLVNWSAWQTLINYGGLENLTVEVEPNASRFFRLVPR